MKFFVKKTISGLIPASRNEFDKLQECKLKLGEFYEVEIKRKRNVQHHRKLFALFNICFDNQDVFDSQDEMRAYLTMKGGFVRKIETPDGIFYLPKSISFSSMEQIEFNDYYEKMITQAMILIGVERLDLIEEINQF